jgi:hypothetical protein
VDSERRYAVRFTLMNGDVAQLTYVAAGRVRAGDVITVSGWRVSVDSIVDDATAASAGLLTGHVLRTTPILGPRRSRKSPVR